MPSLSGTPRSSWPELTLSERAILRLVSEQPGIFRADIPHLLDLSQQSVHRLSERLEKIGFIRTRPSPSGRPGKPSPRLYLRADAAYAFGININPDSLVIALLDLAGNLVDEKRWRTKPLSRDESLQRLQIELPAILKIHDINAEKLVGAGVAIGGFFYAGRERLSSVEPLYDWSFSALRPILEDMLKMPIILANNARTAALGEGLRGIGRLYKTFAYLHFHYGFGTGIVIDRQAYFGPRGNAGEIGVVYSDDEMADRPTLQTLITALSQRDIGIKTIDDLSEHFDPTWPEVSQWVNRVTPGLNRAIHALSGVLDPEAIIFGGHAPPELAHMLIRRVQFRGPNAYGVATPRPDLVVSESIGDAAACGAALMPIKEKFLD